ncbi:hypothetical protein G9U53_26130 [Rhodococcus sp. D-46]|uniref:hypothetical protein n=1 Tax=Rhodococcus sp. D-46 TaxID=2716265 RepID=UPI0013F64682|nr:hypothetical protein [Rhodococcus sp. D-46]
MTDEAPKRYRPISLNKRARTASGLLGLAFGLAGGYSVFANTNQAGSTALLLLGGIFLLMMLTGRVPERIGKDGIEHEAIEDAVVSVVAMKDLMASESEAVRGAAADSYLKYQEAISQWEATINTGSVPISVPASTGSGASHAPAVRASESNLLTAHSIRHEQNVEKLLVEAFGTGAVERHPAFPALRPDAVVTLPSGKRVAVEAKAGRQRKHRFLDLGPAAKRAGLDGMVVVQDMGYSSVPPRVSGTEDVRNVLIATDDTGIDQESAEAVVNEIKHFG